MIKVKLNSLDNLDMIEQERNAELTKKDNIDLLINYGLIEGVDYKYITSHVGTYLKETEQVIFFGWIDFENIEHFVEFIKKIDNNLCFCSKWSIKNKPHVYIMISKSTRLQKLNHLKKLMNEKLQKQVSK